MIYSFCGYKLMIFFSFFHYKVCVTHLNILWLSYNILFYLTLSFLILIDVRVLFIHLNSIFSVRCWIFKRNVQPQQSSIKSHFCKLSAQVKIKTLYLSSVDVKWKQDDYETPFRS